MMPASFLHLMIKPFLYSNLFILLNKSCLRRFIRNSFLLLACLSVANYCVAESVSREEKIKASYVFNFIRFIQWPAELLGQGQDPINVCVINRSDDFIKAFRPVVGKKVNGHPLALQKIKAIDQVSDCHLVYIDKSEKKKVKGLLVSQKNKRILTISDIDTFCKQGGMIGMVNKKGKIRVEINLQVARQAGFHISSNLLEVASIVTSQ